MNNYTAINQECKRRLANFLKKYSKDMILSHQKTLYDFIYDIAASKSLMLSEKK